MAKLLYAGGRLESVRILSGTISENTNGGWYESAYSDCGLNPDNGVFQLPLFDPAAAPQLTAYAMQPGHSAYVHFMSFFQGNPNNTTVTFCDSSGNPWLQYKGVGQMYYNSGTGASPVWTAFGATFGQPQYSTLVPIDIKLDLAANGTHTVTVFYANSQILAPITFTATGFTSLGSITIGGGSLVTGQYMVTEDWSTIGGKVKTTRPTGAGSHSDFAGTYSDVNEQVTNDTTINQASTAGLVQSYPTANITVPNGFLVAGAFNWVRAKNNGNAPNNLKSLVRVAGTDYTASVNMPNMGVGFGGTGARYDVNPATGVAWTQAAWNAPIEMGFASAT